MTKKELLENFRDRAEEFYEIIDLESTNYKVKASKMNRKIIEYRNEMIEDLDNSEDNEDTKLENILLISYVSYIIMLDFRNKFWEYDYMSFSRRIGELWEPFCKLPFEYPIKDLSLYTPPDIKEVKFNLKKDIEKLVNDLSLDEENKKKLLNYYNAIWMIIDNGGNISLQLDLHFKQNEKYYDVDYKSGFSSNEKGNTNRLLLVASIYQSLPEDHNNIIFVRQKENENNHYLKTLINSKLWKVYCSNSAYIKIEKFTGFNLKKWMTKNMDWENDISIEFKESLKSKNLIKYLTW